LLVIADRRLFERVWTEAAAGLPGLYRVLEVIEPERPDLAAHVAEVVNGSLKADIVVGFKEGASVKLLSSLVACCERGVRVRLLTDLYEEMTGRLLIEQLDYAWVMSLPMRSEVSEVYGALKRGASTSSPGPPRCWPSPCFFRSLRWPSSSGTAGPSSIGRGAWADMGGRSKS